MANPNKMTYDRYLERCVSIAGSSDEALDACAKGTSSTSRFAAYFTLTRNEWKGLKLFMGENNNDGVMQRGEGAMCAACHTADWTNTSDYELSVVTPSWAPKGKVPPIFTDHTYDNLGIPKNPHSLTINNPIDLGLGAFKEGYDGNFRVLSLRNIGDTSPYGHNGLFENLYDIVHFYNSRDVESLGEAEVPSTMNTDELGNLGLSYKQEMQLVQFLKTLSD